jgi:hypothetical protein
MKRLHCLFLAFGLALALAIGQNAAALHALGHATDELASHGKAPAPSQCADHSLFTAVGIAAAGKAPVAPFIASVSPRSPQVAEVAASLAPRHGFRSRAPPALS